MAGALARLAIKRSNVQWAVRLFDRLVPTQPLTINELATMCSNSVPLRPQPDEL
jgi:hypothetical protein